MGLYDQNGAVPEMSCSSASCSLSAPSLLTTFLGTPATVPRVRRGIINGYVLYTRLHIDRPNGIRVRLQWPVNGQVAESLLFRSVNEYLKRVYPVKRGKRIGEGGDKQPFLSEGTPEIINKIA